MSSQLTIPFGTITITDTAKRLINECLETKRISCGRLVREFEDRFAGLLGVKEAVAVSSVESRIRCTVFVMGRAPLVIGVKNYWPADCIPKYNLRK